MTLCTYLPRWAARGIASAVATVFLIVQFGCATRPPSVDLIDGAAGTVLGLVALASVDHRVASAVKDLAAWLVEQSRDDRGARSWRSGPSEAWAGSRHATSRANATAAVRTLPRERRSWSGMASGVMWRITP